MVAFRDAVASAARSSLCAVIAVNDDAAKLFGRVPGLKTGADYFNFFAPLRAQLCNDAPSETVPPEPPFTGGQCAGQLYRLVGTITWDVLVCSTGTTVPVSEAVSTDAIFVGPVTSITPRYFDQGACGDRSFIFDVVHDGGNQTSTAFFRTNPTNRSFNAKFSGSAELAGGGDGGCGDPGLVLPPPGDVVVPTTIIYNTNEGDEVTVEGDFTFSPFFSVGDLSINVPFKLDVGGLTFDGTLEVAPEFNLDLSPRIYLGGGGSIDDPGTLLPVPPEETEPIEPEPNSPAIIGVVVRSTPIGELRSTAIATDGMPTIYAPRIASCSFAIQSSLTIAWTSDIPVKSRDAYIPCPATQGAVGVSVSAEPGWECSWVAVRGRPLTPPT